LKKKSWFEVNLSKNKWRNIFFTRKKLWGEFFFVA